MVVGFGVLWGVGIRWGVRTCIVSVSSVGWQNRCRGWWDGVCVCVCVCVTVVGCDGSSKLVKVASSHHKYMDDHS